MSSFIHKNFDKFKVEFEKTFGVQLCQWIEDNIDVKEGKNSRQIEVPKWFLCLSLLSDPDSSFLTLCNRLFGSIKNLNGRSPHEYLANQVHGTLQEVLHKKKLEKRYPDYNFSFIGTEFNRTTHKREIYTKLSRRSISREADLKFTCEQGTYNIHIKANNFFKNKPQITFRGGSNPEYKHITDNKELIHIILSENEYLSLGNFHKLKDYIQSAQTLSGTEAKRWGGHGAQRFEFKKSILTLAKQY